MLSDFIRGILSEHKHVVSLSELESLLYSKKMKVKMNNLASYSSLYTTNTDFVFMKKALGEMKESFLQEFEEYINSKSVDKQAVHKIIETYQENVPDSLYPEWNYANLENKLITFDLLLQFMVRSKNTSAPLKKYFFELIDLYSLIAVYSIVLVKSCDENYEALAGYLKAIDPEEDLVKTMLYEVLIDPTSVKPALHEKLSALDEISLLVDKAINASFRVSINYSQQLFKKVLKNELNKFLPISVLSRYHYGSLYEWILDLIEKQESSLPNKLLDDLFNV